MSLTISAETKKTLQNLGFEAFQIGDKTPLKKCKSCSNSSYLARDKSSKLVWVCVNGHTEENTSPITVRVRQSPSGTVVGFGQGPSSRRSGRRRIGW